MIVRGIVGETPVSTFALQVPEYTQPADVGYQQLNNRIARLSAMQLHYNNFTHTVIHQNCISHCDMTGHVHSVHPGQWVSHIQ